MRGGDLAKEVTELRRVAEQNGRDPKTISVTVFAAPTDKRALDSYEAFGAERAVFFLPPTGADKVLPVLDQQAKLLGPSHPVLAPRYSNQGVPGGKSS